MEDEFYRIKRLPPYVIAEVNGMRAAAQDCGVAAQESRATRHQRLGLVVHSKYPRPGRPCRKGAYRR